MTLSMTETNPPAYETFCIARQPILDRDLNTFGYELLFRNSADKNFAEIDDPDCCTMCVATCGFIKVQESTNQSKKIFVNFTENLLLEGTFRALPTNVTILEILETVNPSPQMIETLIRAKQDGYLIAIDHFHGEDGKEELLNLADIIKIDVLDKPQEDIRKIFEHLSDNKALKLAEKVDSKESYDFLHGLGFDYFQGYFFSQPVNVTGRKIKSCWLTRLKVISELNDPAIETDQLVEIISSDPSIAYRLLRFLNSAAFGFSMKIQSVRHAITLLGKVRLSHWLQMVVLSDLNKPGKPNELLTLALTRGKFLQALADNSKSPLTPESSFLFGMLSLIHVMLDTPFEEILTFLPLPSEFNQAYLNGDGELGNYLTVMEAIENSNFDEALYQANTLNIDSQVVFDAHIRAINWVDSIVENISRSVY